MSDISDPCVDYRTIKSTEEAAFPSGRHALREINELAGDDLNHSW